MHTSSLRNVYTHRDLLYAWTGRIIRARYQQSILGGLWAILQPLAMVAILTVIFTRILIVDTGSIPYPVFSYTAMVPWWLFSNSITDMTDSLVSNMNLIAKIFFPREVLVMAAMFARLLDFVIAFGLLFLVMLFSSMPVFTTAWLYLPLILIIQLTLAFGIGLIGAALNVFLRDIKHIIMLGLQIWFYATPIIYPATLVQEQLPPSWQFVYFLNPMASVVVAYRSVLLNNTAPDSYLWLAGVIAFAILLIGYFFFKRVEYRFADVI